MMSDAWIGRFYYIGQSLVQEREAPSVVPQAFGSQTIELPEHKPVPGAVPSFRDQWKGVFRNRQ
jgi:hypothetical protein